MSRTLALLTILVVATSSGALAAWSGKGTTEPSTRLDLEGFMPTMPDQDPNPAVRVVYFNGFTTTGSPVATTGIQHNAAVVGSAIQLPYAATYAILGVWKDCNGDGYMGSGETAWRYPVALLPDPATCPVSVTFPTHNDGAWVYEFQPITWNNASRSACCDKNSFVDNKALVWLDSGRPTDLFPAPPCQPVPPRFYNQTGAMLARADCETGYAATLVVNALAPEALRFDDVPDGRQGESRSALNQRIPTGDETDKPYVSVFDCTSSPATEHSFANPAGPTQETRVTAFGATLATVPGLPAYVNFSTYTPNLAPGANPDGSAWGTARHAQTYNVFYGAACDPTYTTAAKHHCLVVGPCEAPGYTAHRGRTQPNAMLHSEPSPDPYARDPAAQVLEQWTHFVHGGMTRQFWAGGPLPTPAPLTRAATPFDAQYYTYYARVSQEAIASYALTMPPGTGVYGEEACRQSALDGKVRFVCDASQWWKTLDGRDINATNSPALALYSSMCSRECDPRASVFQAYNLRDVDCLDQAVAAQRESGLTPPHLFEARAC